MGTRLDETPPDGGFTNFCWTSGAFFDPGNPPKYLTVRLNGLLKGDLWAPPDPEPPNGQFVLTQANNVEWTLNSVDIVMGVRWDNANTRMIIIIIFPVPEVPFNEIGPTCVTLLENSFTSPVGRHYYGGTIEALGIN